MVKTLSQFQGCTKSSSRRAVSSPSQLQLQLLRLPRPRHTRRSWRSDGRFAEGGSNTCRVSPGAYVNSTRRQSAQTRTPRMIFTDTVATTYLHNDAFPADRPLWYGPLPDTTHAFQCHCCSVSLARFTFSASHCAHRLCNALPRSLTPFVFGSVVVLRLH